MNTGLALRRATIVAGLLCPCQVPCSRRRSRAEGGMVRRGLASVGLLLSVAPAFVAST